MHVGFGSLYGWSIALGSGALVLGGRMIVWAAETPTQAEAGATLAAGGVLVSVIGIVGRLVDGWLAQRKDSTKIADLEKSFKDQLAEAERKNEQARREKIEALEKSFKDQLADAERKAADARREMIEESDRKVEAAKAEADREIAKIRRQARKNERRERALQESRQKEREFANKEAMKLGDKIIDLSRDLDHARVELSSAREELAHIRPTVQSHANALQAIASSSSDDFPVVLAPPPQNPGVAPDGP